MPLGGYRGITSIVLVVVFEPGVLVVVLVRSLLDSFLVLELLFFVSTTARFLTEIPRRILCFVLHILLFRFVVIFSSIHFCLHQRSDRCKCRLRNDLVLAAGAQLYPAHSLSPFRSGDRPHLSHHRRLEVDDTELLQRLLPSAVTTDEHRSDDHLRLTPASESPSLLRRRTARVAEWPSLGDDDLTRCHDNARKRSRTTVSNVVVMMS